MQFLRSTSVSGMPQAESRAQDPETEFPGKRGNNDDGEMPERLEGLKEAQCW